MNEIHAIDLNLLKSLQALIIERHVGRAAQRMNVTQPAMSHTLARLRRLFDDPLFVKQGRKMVPTARVQELAPRLNTVLSEIAALTTPVTFSPESATATIRIHAHDFIATGYLAGAIQRIRRQAPGLVFEIHSYSDRSYDMLDAGDADLIVGAGLQANPKFLQKLLLRDRLVCLLDRAHPALDSWTAETLFLYPHVRLGVMAKQDDPVHVFGRDRGMPARQIGLITDNLHLQPAFLKETDLIAFVPEMLARQAVDKGNLVLRDSPFPLPELGIRAIWNERDARSPLHSWIRTQLAE
ncbi:LysR family transcriptional regulator [Aliiroseovarius crassostreae]|uniref:LysR family transcriptional regulator n=1 Tax=Aliiroseovarius crassostreae TaxID=154981 RepID=UPI0021FCF7AC|nr:LysR family transcriptional regulator [Aliiroseovarius crassostreae]UWQ04912.1 LysR family transcriptional regulator [Aliiroseovarius crassostreae]